MKVPVAPIRGCVYVEDQDCAKLSQVTTAAVEQYTGEGEPPYCEMTLGTVSDDTIHMHDANFTVTLNGAQPPNNTITVTSAIELPSTDLATTIVGMYVVRYT